ncbi:cell division protein ZipA [Endozoicomonas sp. OPT23]|uniref:cell division protein ZipA n=1 Tax=Endozoicomonas sp. OPT23 TaxID=2072845 RepID=UPI00129AECBA|nr:cell division protein ZipA [Endozoicomonas sp. OPT23]MRI32445.1 cell division protein ZipA [Endozoicomonas sp. OPT23]
MEMSLREWLVLIGIIIIAGVLADGYRRMRLAKKRSEELSFGLEDVAPGEDNYGSELPNGGARKLAGDFDESYEGSHDSAYEKSARQPMESVRSWARQEETAHLQVKDRIEPGLTDFDEPAAKPAQPGKREPASGYKAEDDVPTLTQVNDPVERQSVSQEMSMVEEIEHAQDRITAEQTTRMVQQELAMEPTAVKRAEKKGSKKQEKASKRPSAKEVLVINLLAKEEAFEGSVLMKQIPDAGLKFGEMSIFHRHARKDGTGQVLFSLANGVEPGTFNISRMESSSTPVISLFMGLPGPAEPLKAFTLMAETARHLALDLGAELKDEDMSVLTQQTLEHYRQRIRDFERKSLTQKA